MHMLYPIPKPYAPPSGTVVDDIWRGGMAQRKRCTSASSASENGVGITRVCGRNEGNCDPRCVVGTWWHVGFCKLSVNSKIAGAE